MKNEQNTRGGEGDELDLKKQSLFRDRTNKCRHKSRVSFDCPYIVRELFIDNSPNST